MLLVHCEFMSHTGSKGNYIIYCWCWAKGLIIHCLIAFRILTKLVVFYTICFCLTYVFYSHEETIEGYTLVIADFFGVRLI